MRKAKKTSKTTAKSKPKKAPARKKPAVKKAPKKTGAKKSSAKPVKKAAPKKKVVKKASAKKAVKKVAKVVQPKPAKKRKIRLTSKKADEYKAMLIAMRQRLTGQIANLQGDSLQRQDGVNSEEDGTDAAERQFALNLASSENDVVFEIDEALQRLSLKTYGVCEQCSGGIEAARLNALPFVRMCISCKTENEKGTRRFRPTL